MGASRPETTRVLKYVHGIFLLFRCEETPPEVYSKVWNYSKVLLKCIIYNLWQGLGGTTAFGWTYPV